LVAAVNSYSTGKENVVGLEQSPTVPKALSVEICNGPPVGDPPESAYIARKTFEGLFTLSSLALIVSTVPATVVVKD